MTAGDAGDLDHCLERTRSAVLNVLIVAGLGIALSGWLLRQQDRWASVVRTPRGLGRGMMVALLALAVASYAVRRIVSGRAGSLDPARRATWFYRGHVLAASLAALAVPLGFAYGWLVRPLLDAVGPFWVVALALGFLCLPRAYPDAPGASGPQP